MQAQDTITHCRELSLVLVHIINERQQEILIRFIELIENEPGYIAQSLSSELCLIKSIKLFLTI